MGDNEEERRLRLIVAAANSAILAVKTYLNRQRKRKRNNIPREPVVNREACRSAHMQRILDGSVSSCVDYLRMRKMPFLKLTKLVRELGLLSDTLHVSVEEQLAMFLNIVGHKTKNRVARVEFIRSGETISRYFNEVLRAMFALRDRFMKQPTGSTPPEIVNNLDWYPYFEDCIGMIDGTHVDATVPPTIMARFRGRKGVTQNVLAACTPDKLFTYVLAGWEGSVNDYTVLQDALSLPPPHGIRVLEVAMPNRSPPGNGSSTKSPSAFQGNTPPQLRPLSYPMHPPMNMYHNFAFMSYFANACPQPMQHPNVNPTGPTCMPSGSNEMQDSATESEKSLHSRENESEHTSPSKRRKQQASGKRPISRNKMWLPVHDDLLIPFLADHARKGNKPDKQFKISTLHQAASLINDAFITTFTHDSVKNHVKALRNRFLLMEAAIAISGTSWEKETNTVSMDPETYKVWAAEKANVKLLPYVNTPLKHLDDLRVIVGDDVATGSFRKSVWEDPNSQHSQTPINIPTDDDTPVDVTQVESQTAPQVVREAPQVELRKSSGVTGGSTSRVPRKRSKQRAKVNDNDSDIARSLEHVAIAIAESSWTGKLESKMREFASTYPSKMLDMAVRSLCANEKEATVFGILSREGRGDWLKQFAKDHGFGSSDAGANGVGENPVSDAP